MDNTANLEAGQKAKHWYDIHFVDRGFRPIAISGGEFLKDNTGQLELEGFQEMAKCKSPTPIDIPVDGSDMILTIEAKEWAMGGNKGMSLNLVAARPATPAESKGLNPDPFAAPSAPSSAGK